MWHDIDLSGHVTSPVKWPFDTPGAISCIVPYCNRVCTSSHFRDNGPQRYWGHELTYQGHVTSSITWPIDSPYAISYCCPLKPRYSAPSPVRAHTQIYRHTDTRCKWFIFCPMQYIALDRPKWEKIAPKSTLRTQTTVVPMKLQASQTTPLGYACIRRQTTRLRT